VHLEGESLVTGMAETVVDASLAECVAYEFIKDSNKRKAKLGKVYKAIETKKLNGHSQLYLNRRKLGKGLSPREWRQIVCWQTEKGGTKCWTVYKDTNLLDNDFPLSSGTVLASATTTWLYEALPTDKGTPQCHITFASRVDIKSSVPSFVMNYFLSSYAKNIIDIRNKFVKTDDEKDLITQEFLANVIKNEQQTYTEEEERAIRGAKEFYEKCKEGTGAYEVESPDDFVEMRGAHVDGDSHGVAIATTTVDTSVYECAAQRIIDLNSRYTMKTLKQWGIVDLTVKNINNHSQYYFSTRDLGIPGFAYRDFRTKVTWKKETVDGRDVVWINIQSTDDLTKDYPVKFGHIVGTAHTIWMFESLPPLGGIPQTRATMQTQVDLHSSIPNAFIEKLGTKFLASASRLRKKFDKTNAIDKPRRIEIVKKMKDLKARGDTKLLPLFDMIRPTVGAEGGGKSWGMISVTLRIGFEEAAAYFWDVDRLQIKGLVRESANAGNDFDLEVKAKERIKTTLQSFNVAFVSKMRLYRADKNTLVIMSEAIKERGLQSQATEDFAVRFCRVGKKETKINIVTRLELGKEITKGAAKTSAKRRCSVGVNAAIYFDNLLSSSEANEEDGRRFGDQLMSRVKEMKVGGSKDEVVKAFIKANIAMKEVQMQHKFINTMLCAIVRNKLRRRATNEGEVGSLEEARGLEIGSALKMITVQTATAKHAVDEWAHQYTEVQEVMREYKWVRPMIETIAVDLFKNSKIGLKARVTFGAVTSMTDLVTDVYVTYMFWKDKKYGYGKASLASLIMSIGFQMFMVWGQNRKLGMKRVVREWIPILLGYKPAVDAYRVATGSKQEVGALLDAMSEMTTMKLVEMFAEAIPGVIIQLMAIVKSDKSVGTSAWLSVAVSAITTGFASATISYDWDTDPTRREQTPDFYGYIPAKASKRTVVFVSMLLFTAGMLLIRCTTIVLLGLIEGSWVILYIGADFGLYLLVKILRGDFWYWVPVGGNLELLNSISSRMSIKIITDFTSIVQFRHPNEVGGAYWLFGLVLTMGSLPVSIFIASSYVDERAIDIASSIASSFIPITALCFAVFFLNIERKYLHTFWSTQKSKDYSMAYFLEGESDAIKFLVLASSRHHWVSIEGEIKKWVESNWAKWEEEKPDWFTDVMKAKVPVEFIPTDGDARRRESVRRASVDAEADGGLVGAVRASIRRASVGGADGGDIIGVGGGKAKVSSVVPDEDGK
jgi:hypothetical protein